MNKLQKLLNEKKYLIMGILNFTPDSFSDGGDFYDVNLAIRQVEQMIKDGADIIDIGCESTRPGAEKLSEEEEKKRLEKILPSIRKKFPNVLLSIDTYKKEIATFAIENGVDILNDVLGAKNNSMAQVAAKYNKPIIVMHNGKTKDGDEVNKLLNDLQESVEICLNAGVKKENIIVDPGIGFGKEATENIIISKNIFRLKELGCDILYAVSRKRTTDYILGGKTLPKERDIVSATLSLESIRQGAKIVRVHNVKVMNEMLLAYKSLND